MRFRALLSLWMLASCSSASPVCCSKLHRALAEQVSFPGQSRYETTELSYDALQESDIKPGCILRPNSGQDVARAVSILTSSQGRDACKFAVKGGGHNPGHGFANIESGVTIDMTSLKSIRVSSDRSLAMVDAGAKWVDVYKYLEPYSIIVAGGRNGNVGAGGLLVGGGISHFSPRVGWACDNVVNFEVVLGNGSLVSANCDTNADLYLALKGGGNNFGIVTRFDLAAFPQGNISSTIVINNGSQIPAIFDAFNKIATSPDFDQHTSLVTGPIYNSTMKEWTVLNIAVYTKPVMNPPVFTELFEIPSTSRQTTIASVATISNETQGPPSRQISSAITLKPSLQLMAELFHIMDSFFRSFTPPAGSVQWVLAFEPLVAGLINPARGVEGNVLGLDKTNLGYILMISPSWTDAASNHAVEKATRHIVSLLQSHAESRDLLQRFEYLNYAAPFQQPLKSYGEDELRLLRTISQEYDSGQVFQERVPGGFKLWNSAV